jgi:D-arabinose 1-dehydrogenase-like Zn-dependent alcohol dehydrogenase
LTARARIIPPTIVATIVKAASSRFRRALGLNKRVNRSIRRRTPSVNAAAAAIPLAGLTALQALRDELDVKPGQRVFVSGGAGGVGTFAIQIAKWLGAHVTTTASKRGEALVRSLGSDEVIDYTSRSVSEAGPDFDAGF